MKKELVPPILTASIKPEEIVKHHPAESPIKLEFAKTKLEIETRQIENVWGNMIRALAEDVRKTEYPYCLAFGSENIKEATLLLLEPITVDKSCPETKIFIAITQQGPYSIPATKEFCGLIGERYAKGDKKSTSFKQLAEREGIVGTNFNIFSSETEKINAYAVNVETPTVEIIKKAIEESKKMVLSIDDMLEVIAARKLKEEVTGLKDFFQHLPQKSNEK